FNKPIFFSKSSQPPRLRSQICHSLPGGLASAIAGAGSSSSFFRCHVVLTSSPLRRPLFAILTVSVMQFPVFLVEARARKVRSSSMFL
ncbi:unnamed protein product, partial [Brassica rapa subsp. narinosa]